MAVTLILGAAVLLVGAFGLALARMARDDAAPPLVEDDRVSRAWLEMFIRERRE